MDKDLKAQLEDQLYERMSHENEAYLADLRTKPADEIINSAYQIACRENILYLFEEETPLNVRQLQVLMEMSSPLRELYEDWCGRDSNEMELLRGSIEDSTSGILNHRAEIRYSDPKTPIYEKTLAQRTYTSVQDWTVLDANDTPPYDLILDARGYVIVANKVMPQANVQASECLPRLSVGVADHKLYYYTNENRNAAITMQYTKTTD